MYLDEMLLVYLEVSIMIFVLFKYIAAIVNSSSVCIPPVHFLNTSPNCCTSEIYFSQ
jgi:hypothetical protein